MINLTRDVRPIPLVLVAVTALFALKFSGLVLDGGYTLGDRLAGRDKKDLKIVDPSTIPETPRIVTAEAKAARQRSWAQEMFNYPDHTGDITGSVGEKKDEGAKEAPADKNPKKKVENPPKDPGGTVISTEPARVATAGERAVLERLQDRRQEIESRARELEMRENLLKQAEQRIEAKLLELKNLDARLNGEGAEREKAERARFKSLVSMYENMKPKDAARIFDRLDLKILVDVTTQINPRKMSDILGQMSAESAERLTVELARRAAATEKPAGMRDKIELPKIEGQTPAGKPPQISQKGP